MPFPPKEPLPLTSDNPGTYPDAFVKQFAPEDPEGKKIPAGPNVNKKSRALLALQNLVGGK